MSRIGKKPVPVPSGVKAEVASGKLNLSGPKGSVSWGIPAQVDVAVASGEINVSRRDDSAFGRAMHGTARALIANMVKGVREGYEIGLELYGTGYSAKLQGRTLLLNCGFMGRGYGKSAQFSIPIPNGLDVKVAVEASRGNNDAAKLTVSGIDKQQVGQFAAEVRKLRKPEPYLGKGIRYAGEVIRRKAGKVFAGGG